MPTTTHSSIICGNCRGSHSLATEVRACYQGTTTPVVPTTARATRSHTVMTSSGTATDPQIQYLSDLLDARPALVEIENLHPDVIGRMDFEDASYWITYCLDTPRASTPPVATTPAPAPVASQEIPNFDDIPDGRYALGTDDNATFFQVTRRRNGQINLVRLTGSPGDWRKTPLFHSRQQDTLRLIGENPGEAMVRFGRIFKVCGRCCAPLSDAVSRARYIGPECALTMGLESHHDYAVRHPELDSVY